MNAGLFVVTGGPGAGKSSLVEALAARGVRTMPEVGRAIIREQMASGGDALPWADRVAFADLMFERELGTYEAARRMSGPVVLDRGIPDVIGYLMLCRLPVPGRLRAAARRNRYERRVFVAPHWPAIYAADAERRQSPAEAVATERAITRVYRALGYELVALPLGSVERRADFVMARIGAAPAREG